MRKERSVVQKQVCTKLPCEFAEMGAKGGGRVYSGWVGYRLPLIRAVYVPARPWVGACMRASARSRRQISRGTQSPCQGAVELGGGGGG